MIAGRGAEATVIVNPFSGRISRQLRDEVTSAIRARLRIDVHVTTARGSAIPLASDAAERGVRLVIAFGGDGHVNEVANGVAGTDSTLAIIPGGTMNVFARTLGIPLDPFAALSHLQRVWDDEPRRVPLGKMDDRYFTFSAGCGFDAEAAELVERQLFSKKRFGELFFYWSAFRVLATSHRHRQAWMTLSGPFGTERVAMAIACNSGPYAYLLNRPIQVAPEVRLEGGLDVFALRSMRIENLPIYAWRAGVSGDLVRHRDALYESDLRSFELKGDRPFHRHVDGEPLEPSERAEFGIVEDALKVQV